MTVRTMLAMTATVLALGSLSLPAGAKSGVKVGALSCTVEGGVGLILGSSKEMNCTFDPAGSGKRERYTGRITKLGLDIGVTGESYIRWLVFAPGKIERGALEGSYGGASAEATVGVGLGANVLVGGLKDSIALQPVSVQGQEGLNIAAGISSMKLEAE
jgi:hypothetical protein